MICEHEGATSMTDLPPAGWYPNPDNAQQQRYWNGEQWTEHIHDPHAATTQHTQAQPEAQTAATTPLPSAHTAANPTAESQYGGYPQSSPGGYVAPSPGGAPTGSKVPLIIGLVVIGVLLLGFGGYFLWNSLNNEHPVPTAEPTPTQTSEPTTPTTEPTGEPTDPSSYDEVIMVSGPTDVGALDPNKNWVVSIYGAGSEWESLGSAWEFESFEGNWLKMTSPVNSCHLLHTSGSPTAAGMTFTDPGDEALSTYEFAYQLLPNGPTLDDYRIYGIYWAEQSRRTGDRSGGCRF